MKTTPLSPDELELWHLWKRASETVMTGVERDLLQGSGLSGADFGVLSRLVDLGKGEMRHQQLADSMGWDKSRLSHHVNRMCTRELVARRAAGGGEVWVTIKAEGRARLKGARAVHAGAVRRHLLDVVPDRSRFLSQLALLAPEKPPA